MITKYRIATLALASVAFLAFSLPILSQDKGLSKEEKREKNELRKIERNQVETMLKAYVNCPAGDSDFVIFRVERVDKDAKRTLARETADGVKAVSRTDSYDVLITFKDKMRFANLRPDRSDPDHFEIDKGVALESLEYYNGTGKSMISSSPIEKVHNGLRTFSIYRAELTGNQLGISLIFDDQNKMITTVYFINAPKNSGGKNYSTWEEWSKFRGQFLESYTSCVANGVAPSAERQVN